jgi:hypothetical protein
MKKIKVLLASALVIGAIAVNAQDTTRVSGQDKTAPQDQTQTPKQDQPNYLKDMTVIQASEVPASLRSTLQGDQYKGWESNSTIYRSKNSDQFVVEMREGNQTKIHRFDKNGKAVKEY